MKQQVIRLTESDIHNIIRESVYQILSENAEDEGWAGNLWNKATSAAKGVGNMMTNGGGANGFKAGYNDARANYMSGEQNKADEATWNQIQELDKQIAQLQQQRNKLASQQPGKGQFAQQANNYAQKANQARQNFRNAWGAAPQQ